jgi:hypothetical protein
MTASKHSRPPHRRILAFDLKCNFTQVPRDIHRSQPGTTFNSRHRSIPARRIQLDEMAVKKTSHVILKVVAINSIPQNPPRQFSQRIGLIIYAVDNHELSN